MLASKSSAVLPVWRARAEFCEMAEEEVVDELLDELPVPAEVAAVAELEGAEGGVGEN